MEIDFVITWVDMDDPQWKADFAKHSGKIDLKTKLWFRDHAAVLFGGIALSGKKRYLWSTA